MTRDIPMQHVSNKTQSNTSTICFPNNTSPIRLLQYFTTFSPIKIFQCITNNFAICNKKPPIISFQYITIESSAWPCILAWKQNPLDWPCQAGRVYEFGNSRLVAHNFCLGSAGIALTGKPEAEILLKGMPNGTSNRKPKAKYCPQWLGTPRRTSGSSCF